MATNNNIGNRHENVHGGTNTIGSNDGKNDFLNNYGFGKQGENIDGNAANAGASLIKGLNMDTGNDDGAKVAQTAEWTIQGAKLGNSVGGWIGAIVGGVVGLGGGLIKSGSDTKKWQRERRKEYQENMALEKTQREREGDIAQKEEEIRNMIAFREASLMIK